MLIEETVMDEHVDKQQIDLDHAIDASKKRPVGADAGPVGEAVDRVRAFANSGPDVDAARVRRSIEERLESTTQLRPWWSPRLPKPQAVGRRLATGGAVAAVTLAIAVGSLVSSSGSASAAFLENVQQLNALTETATADGIVDDTEAAAIAELVEQLRAQTGAGSLDSVDPDDLAEALVVLHSIEDMLDHHDGGDDGIKEISRAVVAVIDHDDHDGDEDGEHHEGDHDDDQAFSDEEIAASLAALDQLEADFAQLRLDADAALSDTLAGFAASEDDIAAARSDALALVASIPDLPDLQGLSSEELKAILGDLGIVVDGEHHDGDDDHEGDHHDGEEHEDDDEHEGIGDRFEDTDADHLAAALVDQYFDSPHPEIDQLLHDLRAELEGIERQAKELTEPFDEEFRYSRDDANALLHELKDYLDGLEAEARVAEASLENQIRDARSVVAAAVNEKLGALIDAFDQDEQDHEDGDAEHRDHEDDDREGDHEHEDEWDGHSGERDGHD
jgi:hypothetical protein